MVFQNHEWRRAKTTFTNGPCMPIILWTALDFTELAVERKWRVLSDNICETADTPLSFKSDKWKHFGFPVRRTR